MAAQTSYSIYTRARLHGNLSDIRDYEADSYISEGSAIPMGVVVSQGTTDDQAVLGGAVAGVLGITIKDLGLEGKAPGDATLEYKENDVMSVLRRGTINIAIPSGGAKGAALKYNETTGVIDAGAPAAGETALPLGYSLETTVQAGEVAIIRLSGQNV